MEFQDNVSNAPSDGSNPRGDGHFCMICNGSLRTEGEKYNVAELISEIYKVFHVSGKNDALLDEKTEITQLFVCESCKFGIFLPQIDAPPGFYETISTSQDYYPSRRWDFDEAISDLPTEVSILDVGCGAGKFLELASPLVKEAVGCEANQKGLDACRSKGLTAFKSFEELASRRASFDGVFSFQVLEHVADPVSFLRELSSFVKPGGFIGISVPNMNGVVKYIAPCFSNMPPHHATHWRAITLRILAGKLGLKVIRISFEPLNVHQYSYSTYFANKLFPGSFALSIAGRWIARRLITRILSVVLFLLHIFKSKNFPFFHDMSLYVLMQKIDH